MKIFSLALAMVLFSPSALSAPAAEEPLALTCVTEFPTTSFVVWTEGESVKARVIHHNGSGYAPAIVGTFTPNDLPILAERAALVKKMKPDMTFTWPRAKCKKLGEMVLQCFGTDDVQEGEGGARFAPFALYSTAKEEFGIAGRLRSHSVTLTFDVDGQHGASIEMWYPEGSCFPSAMKEIRGVKLR